MTTDLSDVQLEHVQTIISSGEDLLGLINNILDHSRIESGSVTPERISFSLRHVVEDAVEALAAVGWSKEIDLYLTSSFSADPPGLIGDPFRIKQILLNLVSNAIKFTRKGRVTITWRYEQLREDEVKVWVEVEDTGIGIPAHSEISCSLGESADASKKWTSCSVASLKLTKALPGISVEAGSAWSSRRIWRGC